MSEHCHNVVTRAGEQQPCEKPAVGWRYDEGQPYPVCRHHWRPPFVTPVLDILGQRPSLRDLPLAGVVAATGAVSA